MSNHKFFKLIMKFIVNCILLMHMSHHPSIHRASGLVKQQEHIKKQNFKQDQISFHSFIQEKYLMDICARFI